MHQPIVLDLDRPRRNRIGKPITHVYWSRMLFILPMAIQPRHKPKSDIRLWLLCQAKHPLIDGHIFNYRGCWVCVITASVVCRLPPAAAVPASPPLLPSQALPSGGLGTPSPAGGGLSSSSSLGQFRSDCTSYLGATAFAGLAVMVGGDGVTVAGDDLHCIKNPVWIHSRYFGAFWNVKKSL